MSEAQSFVWGCSSNVMETSWAVGQENNCNIAKGEKLFASEQQS